jgi:hypothetical protein
MIALNISIKHDLNLPEEIEAMTEKFAEQIPIEARRIIDESPPRGRLYRRGAITGRRTQAGLRMGLKPRGKTRMITGTRIHRASAPGQPPAVDSGRLRREIKVRRSGRGKFQVIFAAPYAGIVEYKLNRPFAFPAIVAAAHKVFGANV